MSTATVPEQLVLPVFTVPNVRRDFSAALAICYRESCLHDAGEGAFFSAEYLAKKYLKCHPGSVRRYWAMLEKCGLVELRLEHGRELYVRPLVHLQDLFPIWPALAFVCSTCSRLSALMRNAARQALKTIKGVMAQYRPDHTTRRAPKEGSPAGRSGGIAEGSSNAEVCALCEPSVPPLSCLQRRRGDETTTSSVPKTPERPSTPSKSETPEAADASLTELAAPLIEALGETPAKPLTTLAQKLGRTPGHVRQCVRALKAKSDVLNPGAYLRRLIEAPEGTVAPPAPPIITPSDRGERPQRLTQEPPEVRRAREAEEQASQAHQDALRAAWESLDDTRRCTLLEAQAEVVRRSGGPADREHLRRRGLNALPVWMPARRAFIQTWEGLIELEEATRIEQAHQLALEQLRSELPLSSARRSTG